ncbi:acyl-CoA dehydrogenase family protein [Nocardioides sp.]|uniref:acyl-CoA dehydrogenase family protein n=1 Tax=Nocardioides sp. TaxID=35761 RepID=UPI00351800C7
MTLTPHRRSAARTEAATGSRPEVRPDRPAPGRDLGAQFAPLLAELAEGALRRELDDELPIEPVRRLKEAGFGALRVPVAHGGRGASIPELTQLWIDGAAADATLTQVFRGHFALVEDRLWQHARGADQQVWFTRFLAGQIAGNAWSEAGATLGTSDTLLTRRADGDYRLDGRKAYTTGTIYAEYADVHARLDQAGGSDGPSGAGEDVIALVDTRQAGVNVLNDWDGFGQRGTGSGTTTFEGAHVPAVDVLPFADRFPYQAALYQLNLLATLAGIGRAARRDAVAHVQRRERTYSHGNAPRVRDDAQILAQVGQVAAAAFVAEAATARVAESLQRVADLAGRDPGDREVRAAAEAAEIEAGTAQVAVTAQVLTACTELFDTLGASATARSAGLDRHWRNARTVASHNPRLFKARVVGDHLVNGAPPPYAWSIGATRRDQEWPRR